MYKYKCSECGQEYNDMPEYCDCGNDSFEAVEVIEPSFDNAYQAYTGNKTQKNGYKSKRLEPYAIAVFVLCMILSLVILFIPVSSSTDKKSEEVKPKKQTLPSIDEIWNDITPQNEVPQKTEQAVQTAADILENIKTNVQKNIQKPAVKKSQTVQVKTAAPVKQQVVPKKSAPPKKTTSVSGTPAVQTQKTSAPKTSVPKTVKPAINPAVQKQALLNYKIALRNKIVSNINFGAIVGDGDCVISFKISQSGKLTNRAFAKQSANDSLNDAVYNGIMLTPAYNPPPSGYKNETLKLTVKMYGGNFEVDLN